MSERSTEQLIEPNAASRVFRDAFAGMVDTDNPHKDDLFLYLEKALRVVEEGWEMPYVHNVPEVELTPEQQANYDRLDGERAEGVAGAVADHIEGWGARFIHLERARHNFYTPENLSEREYIKAKFAE